MQNNYFEQTFWSHERRAASTEALYREHDHICWSHRVKLSRPFIEIVPMGETWADWNPEFHRIRVSEKLVEKYPWHMVVGILKHEMAHQIVSEIFASHNMHSDLFESACKMIAVPEKFRCASCDIGEPSFDWKNEKDAEDDGMLRKLEKLMSLAQSSNEHEASLAMERTQELIAKYNLERSRERRKSKHIHIVIPLNARREKPIHDLISSILTSHFFVFVVHARQFDFKHMTEMRVLELVGTRQNVLVAEYVFHFLQHTAESLWHTYKNGRSLGVAAKNSFQRGLLMGFKEKMRKSKSAVMESFGSESHSLVAMGDAELEAHARAIFPRLYSMGGGGPLLHHAEHFDAGKVEGHKINISKAMSETRGSSGRMLLT